MDTKKLTTADWKKVYAEQAPPAFGHDLLPYFMLDPEYTNLNNGSYGTTPRPVHQAAYDLNVRIEANPDLFHRLDYQPLLTALRGRLAALIGAKTDEVVLVTNASTGVNTVLRNFSWEEGDIIFSFSTTYGSVALTSQYLTDIEPHPTQHVLQLDFPLSHAEIISKFVSFLQAHPAPPNKKRVAIIDSIVSNPGVYMPWKEMVKICKGYGVWSVVDAAHSVGQEVGINLTESAPDFWTSNCHKWLSSKRACAILYVPERNQHIIKSSIPTSHAYSTTGSTDPTNFAAQYECTGNGTIDWAPCLTVADALDFRTWLGGEEKINTYCHTLAVQGGAALARILGTKVMESPRGELTLNMVNVALPLPPSVPPSAAISEQLQVKIMFEHKAYAAVFYHNGAWWIRCSAQVYNDMSDFEGMGHKFAQVCKDIINAPTAKL